VVGTFPGQGLDPEEVGGCLLRCSVTQFIQGKPQASATLCRAHF